MTLAWNRLGASALLPVLVMLVALACGCGGSADAEAENKDSCGCGTSGAKQYGVAKGKATLKNFLIDSAAKHPEGSEMQAAYRRALTRFSELEAFYTDSSLAPDERSAKVQEKLTALMWSATSNESAQNAAAGDQP